MHNILLAAVSSYFADHYIEQVPYFVAVCLLPIVVWLKDYIRWPLIAMGAYLLLQAVILPAHPGLGWFPPKEFIVWTVILGAGWLMGDAFKNPWWIPLGVIMVWCGQPLFYNTALNQAFLVALIPFAPAWQAGLVMLFMVTQPFSFAATGMLLIALLAHWPILSIGGVAAASGVLTLWPGLVHSKMARVRFWEYLLLYFQEKLSLWFGSGLGTFMVLGTKIQSLHSFEPHNAWFSAHNDYLQWFFETGLVGVVLLLWLVIDTARRLDTQERLVGLCIGALAFSYFPQDVPLFQLLIATLVMKGQSRR